MRRSSIKVSGEPIPNVKQNNVTHYAQSCDPKEQYMSRNLKTLQKEIMSFPPSRQTVLNVGVLTTCLQCHKSRSIYEKKKMSANQIISLMRLLKTSCMLVKLLCQTFCSMTDVLMQVLQSIVFTKENIS